MVDLIVYSEFSTLKTVYEASDTRNMVKRVINVHKKAFIPLEILLVCIHSYLCNIYLCLFQSEDINRDILSNFDGLFKFLTKIELVKEYLEEVEIMVYTDIININYGEVIDKVKRIEFFRDLYIEKKLLLKSDECVENFGSFEDIVLYIQNYYDIFLQILNDKSLTKKKNKLIKLLI
jgi:hypothetical protein